MLDKKKFRWKYFLKLATSYATLIPIALGVTVAVASVALGIKASGFGVFLGLLTCLVGVGVFLSRLLVGSESTAEKVVEEMQAEDLAKHHAELQQLLEELEEDDDTRDEEALRDLIAMKELLAKGSSWKEGVNAHSLYQLESMVDDLFVICIQKLRDALELKRSANSAGTKTLEQTLRRRRESIIKEIQRSVKQASKTLDGFTAVGIGDGNDTELVQLNADLEQSLQVARDVDREMKAPRHDPDEWIEQ